MERSFRYQEAIEKVRRLPQETSAEKVEKREQARLLRMQILLDNAKLARFLTQSLYENPTLTPEKLEDLIQEKNLVVHAEATERIVRLFSKRSKIRPSISLM